MARIRQKGTKAEIVVGKMLHECGRHYRKNVRALPGSPDFANQSRRWAIFVNGCFWHNHTNCKKASVPKSNTEFWRRKFHDNRRRDAIAIVKLRLMRYKVLVIWECDVHSITKKLAKFFETRRINSS